MLGSIMNELAQPGNAQALSQALGGVMGGSQQGGAPVGQLLSGLEQVIGGNPSTGQLQAQSGAVDPNNPVMGLIGPVANVVAAKAGVSPQVATTVAGIAMHYLLSSHPAAGGRAPLNLSEITQQMASGSVSQQTLQSSGMVNAVVKATGLSQQQAAKSLDATFAHLATHVNKERLAGKQKAKRDF